MEKSPGSIWLLGDQYKKLRLPQKPLYLKKQRQFKELAFEGLTGAGLRSCARHWLRRFGKRTIVFAVNMNTDAVESFNDATHVKGSKISQPTKFPIVFYYCPIWQTYLGQLV